MAPNRDEKQHRGQVKDPEHDGRLKENREAGQTKGTTPGSAARAQQHGQAPDHGRSGSQAGGESQSGSRSRGESQESGQGRQEGHLQEDDRGKGEHTQGASSHPGGESDDLKSREYKDAEGNVHHHTRTHQEQHGKK